MTRPTQLSLTGTGTGPTIAADFSADLRHRYRLECRWGPGPALPWAMCNPSLAGSEAYRDNLDPTLRRCRSFTEAAGLRAFVVVNVFAVIDPDPSVLRGETPEAPTEQEVDAIRWAVDLANAEGCPGLVCAWGAHPRAVARAQVLMPELRRAERLLCLRQTGAGHPGHPLYLPGRLRLVPWGEG